MHITSYDLHVLVSPPLYVIVLLLGLSWWLHRRSLRGARNAALVGAAFLYLTSVPVVTDSLLDYLEQAYAPPSKTTALPEGPYTTVVLTAGWAAGIDGHFVISFGQAGWERISSGVQVWKRYGGKLLFTGAPMPDGHGSIAESMAQVAHDLGVPTNKLLVETGSHNTYESLLYTRDMLAKAGRTHVILVTSAIHMRRSMAIAERLGMQVTPFPCDYRTGPDSGWRRWFPSSHGMDTLEQALHELIGIAWYRLHGWV